MKYIYTNDNCPKCVNQKEKWHRNKVDYVERSADRLKGGHADFDDIDQDALVQLNMQNLKLPVVIEVHEL